jgi:uncharacterized protein
MRAAEFSIDGRASRLRLAHARRWHERALGLLLTPRLDDPVGLWIDACNSVHMLGMRYAIDAVFLDAEGRVLRIAHSLRPWRVAACWRARVCVELRAGLAAELGLQPGSQLAWCAARN